MVAQHTPSDARPARAPPCEPAGPRPRSGIALRVEPHPVRAAARLAYERSTRAAVSLRLFDLHGRLAAALVEVDVQSAGPRPVSLDASRLRPGLYFVRLQVASRARCAKLTIIR